jgi:hypothetical protein
VPINTDMGEMQQSSGLFIPNSKDIDVTEHYALASGKMLMLPEDTMNDTANTASAKEIDVIKYEESKKVFDSHAPYTQQQSNSEF